MPYQRNTLLSVLKLTQEGPTTIRSISRDSHIPPQIVDETLQQFSHRGLLRMRDNKVEVSANQRLKIIICAIKLGGDFERVCRSVRWDEFENITAKTFSANNFTVERNFRFKQGGRRWEVDVIGFREPIIACVDCKHWRHGWGKSASVKAADAQLKRTEALGKTLPAQGNLSLTGWKEAILIPIILSLVPGPLKFYNNLPIVPILQLRNFLNELPICIEELKSFSIKLPRKRV